MNNETHIAGDDMIALLLSEGGSEAATFAPDDISRDALIARNREIFTRCPKRDAVIDYYDISMNDHRELEMLGLIRHYPYSPGQYYSLTDAGAALGQALRRI